MTSICGLYDEIIRQKSPVLSSGEAKLASTLIEIAKKELKDDLVIQAIELGRSGGDTVIRADAVAALRMIKDSLGLNRPPMPIRM